MTDPTLAEVIEEGRRLTSDAARHTDGDLRCGRAALRLLPRLLAVAEAATEWSRLRAGKEEALASGMWPDGVFSAIREAEESLDSAVRGAK